MNYPGLFVFVGVAFLILSAINSVSGRPRVREEANNPDPAALALSEVNGIFMLIFLVLGVASLLVGLFWAVVSAVT